MIYILMGRKYAFLSLMNVDKLFFYVEVTVLLVLNFNKFFLFSHYVLRIKSWVVTETSYTFISPRLDERELCHNM